MSDIPERENRAAEAKRMALTDKGMQRIGWIFNDPTTNRRATLDYFGRVQWWEIDGSGRMHNQAERIAELQAERDEIIDSQNSAWGRVNELKIERANIRAERDKAYTLSADQEARIAELEAENMRLADSRHGPQACGEHPAPCARHCEASAFNAEIRQLKAENERLRSVLTELAGAESDEYMGLNSEGKDE
ncbi:hypothetical protein V5738_11095 [Salinisphaera sp. SPP-AMP-43]|uniref:hypothetical protein n=1 Tax=Salinisphaera sp. SPP-AMP-43 TaxID=3121288 RepID=UPI003C6E833F